MCAVFKFDYVEHMYLEVAISRHVPSNLRVATSHKSFQTFFRSCIITLACEFGKQLYQEVTLAEFSQHARICTHYS